MISRLTSRHARASRTRKPVLRTAVRKTGLRVRDARAWRDVNLEIIPVKGADQLHFLVVFEDGRRAEKGKSGKANARERRPTTPAGVRTEDVSRLEQELASSREYLQSIIQELNTLNEELHSRNEELGRLNSDLVTLLASVQIAIVIVTSDLRIRRLTPMAERALNLLPGDVGRPIGQIKPNIDCPDLEQAILGVIDSVVPTERQVRDMQGNWYSLRIRPY